MTRPSLTRDQVRAVDRVAIERYGVPGAVLMENAGLLAALRIERALAGRTGPVRILAGGGNNGGDAYVVARQLDLRGHAVELAATVPAARLTGDAALQRAIVDRLGLPVDELEDAAAVVRVLGDGPTPAGVVDGLLGTGARGSLRPPLPDVLAAVEALRGRGVPVVALDLPSGLDCDRGEPLDPGAGALRADLTLTFVARKAGFDRPGSTAFTGAVEVLPIGVPDAVVRAALGA